MIRFESNQSVVYVPLQIVLRIMDRFIIEGWKALIKAAITIFILSESKLITRLMH